MTPHRPAVAALLAVLALAGCGHGQDPGTSSPAPPRSTSAPPASTPDTTPDTTTSATAPPSRDPLADAVESLDPDALDAGPRPAAPRAGALTGGDVSWPQCPKGMGIPQKRSKGSPMPLATAQFVVVGLTNGPGFHANPCLADQVAWVRERGLPAAAYSVISWPQPVDLSVNGGRGPYDGSSRLGALANAGYQQAVFNVRSMRAAGLSSPIVWLDVEPVPDFGWSADVGVNAVVVAGAARGYREAGYEVGVYSTPSMWRAIVGELSLGAAWEWRPAGATGREGALARCGEDWSIQGGRGALAQWVEQDRDLDVTCPGAAARLGQLFHQL